ncbi:MAG: ABC transporter permease [Cyclobacteriaceae bacterium]|nr:ABC transporter permease [Cyclobacteriaceae bacterium]
MLRNYLTVAFRNIRKYKFFSFINIAGLTIGMACCLLLFIYVMDEISYDRFHWEAEKVYRIGLHGRIGDQDFKTCNSSLPVGPALQAEVPGIESVLRLKYATAGAGFAMRNGEKIFTEEKIVLADSNFFTFFSFPLLQGDARTVLNEPNTIVITEALARKYFGTTDCLGQMLVVGNDRKAVKVTGIAAEPPTNSHFRFQAVISFATVEKDYYAGWGGNAWQTYTRVNPQTSIADINRQLDDIVAKNMGKELEEGLGISFEEFKKQGGIYSYFLYPMTDTHLRSALADDLEPKSSLTNVYIFSGVGLFILLIACVNFMNLSTARSAGRAKEVGLRKTLGSQRGQMMGQFLAESFVYSGLAIVGAIALSYLLLPSFNELAGKQLTLDTLYNPAFFAAVAVLLVIVGLMAGSYPAFYMTSFSAVEVLKGKVRAGVKSKGIRSSLVVFQFAVSTFLIIATAVVFQQLNFMQSKNLGMDKENVISVTGVRRLGTNARVFKTSATEIPGVVAASYTGNSFPGTNNTNLVREKNKEVDHILGTYSADWDHVDVMKMEIIQGRNFSRDNAGDSLSCLVNEATVREFGFTDPLAHELTDFGGETPTHYRIIGVIKDFNFESLKDKVRPVMIRLGEDGRELSVRYEGDPKPVIASLEKQWKEIAPGEPFEYNFMDQEFDALFRSEMRLRDIFTVFSLLAIVIASLGLFALAAFTTEQRTKEIGVRKAMGASVFSLTFLLSKEFTRLVLIAIVPAIAGGWYVANWWLSSFSYRITLSPLIFVGCGLLAIVIAWATVSYQAIRAASVDPVKSLRYE